MPPPPGTRVLVVDDHAVLRRGIVALLDGAGWAVRPVEASSVAEARRLAVTEQPALAVVDVGLPDGDGVDLVAELATLAPACRCLVLTMDRSPGTAVRAMGAGACGYLAKDCDPQLVVDALATLASGGVVLGLDLGSGGLRLGTATEPAGGPLSGLTPREAEIARAVAEGLGNQAIARRLGLSEKTIRNLLSGLLPKVGARDRVHLAVLVREDPGRGT